MKLFARLIVGLFMVLMLPVAAGAADDPFLGTWRLDKTKSIIANDPGVKMKEFRFAPGPDGVVITETVQTTAPDSKPEVSEILYAYGRSVEQHRPGIDHLLVTRADDHTVYWTTLAKGEVASQLQVVLSPDGRQMTFRYLFSIHDPQMKAFNDRYVYVKQ